MFVISSLFKQKQFFFFESCRLWWPSNRLKERFLTSQKTTKSHMFESAHQLLEAIVCFFDKYHVFAKKCRISRMRLNTPIVFVRTIWSLQRMSNFGKGNAIYREPIFRDAIYRERPNPIFRDAIYSVPKYGVPI